MQPDTHTYRQRPDERPDRFRNRVKRLLATRFDPQMIEELREQQRGSRLCVIVKTRRCCHGVAGR